MSSDGSRIVYVTSPGPQGARLVVRSLDRFETTELTNLGDAARGPFFSPDGTWVGYQAVASHTQATPVLAKIQRGEVAERLKAAVC